MSSWLSGLGNRRTRAGRGRVAGDSADDQFGQAEFYIDLLAEWGVHVGEPYTRHLGGKLRELRFYLGPSGDAVRISYYIATGRRIILLTVFRKQRQRETAEVDRARRAMDKCIAEGHILEDGDE